MSSDDVATVGSNLVFFFFVCEEPGHLIAGYGVVKVVEAPEKINAVLWAVKSK